MAAEGEPPRPQAEGKPPSPEAAKSHLSVPPKEPQTLSSGDEVTHISSVDTTNFDGIKLCLPNKLWTFLASLVVGLFSFLGLLFFGFAEVGLPNGHPKELWPTLWFRLLGWMFVFHIPMVSFVIPTFRNFVYWDLHPNQSLAHAWPNDEDTEPSACRRCWRAISPAFVWLLVLAFTILIFWTPFEKSYLGFQVYLSVIVPLASVLTTMFAALFGPPMPSKSYSLPMLPLCAGFLGMGCAALVAVYLPLRGIGGPWTGLLLPCFLSIYELLATKLVARRFVNQFVTKMDVRKAYCSTNQGITVSIAICNLHAIAEGARFALLFAEHLHDEHDCDEHDADDYFSVLIPILGGVVWNVSSRIGCFDRFLYFISCQHLKPNNSSKLLRDSGYCMGYPRFGAAVGLALARQFLGTGFSWDAFEVHLFLMIFAAEVLEDILSYALWRRGIDVSPKKHFATDQEVELTVLRRASRELSRNSVVPVDSAGRSKVWPDAEDRWKTRAAHDFRYGPHEFGQLPWWAHFIPAALAQFLTIFAMIVTSKGLVFLLGFCDPSDKEVGLAFWPVIPVDDLCS